MAKLKLKKKPRECKKTCFKNLIYATRVEFKYSAHSYNVCIKLHLVFLNQILPPYLMPYLMWTTSKLVFS